MYTQCPKCKTSRTINVEELRTLDGIVCCDNCSSSFNVLELLNEGILPENSVSGDPHVNFSHYPDERKEKLLNPGKTIWRLGVYSCLMLFVAQIYFFEAYNLSQNAMLRPWLEKISTVVNKTLPVYKNVAEFSILHGSFEPAANNTFIFKTALINQADFSQYYPSIKLTLIDFTGKEFASRIFIPQDYLQGENRLIKPDTSIEISLTVVAPSDNIGGYHFELI